MADEIKNEDDLILGGKEIEDDEIYDSFEYVDPLECLNVQMSLLATLSDVNLKNKYPDYIADEAKCIMRTFEVIKVAQKSLMRNLDW